MLKSCVALHFEQQNDDTTQRFNHAVVLLVACFVFLSKIRKEYGGKVLRGKGIGPRLQCVALTPCPPYYLFCVRDRVRQDRRSPLQPFREKADYKQCIRWCPVCALDQH